MAVVVANCVAVKDPAGLAGAAEPTSPILRTAFASNSGCVTTKDIELLLDGKVRPGYGNSVVFAV
jgi:hypothetical protein